MSLRSSLSSRLRLPDLGTSRALRPATVHADRPVGQDAGRLVYIGGGRNDPQGRPSQLFNPFFYLCESDAVANDLYGKWLADRADIDFFLQPVLGVALLCDCDRGLGCHSHVLRRVLDQVYPLPGNCEPYYGRVNAAFSSVPSALSRTEKPPEVSSWEVGDESDDSGTVAQVVTPMSKPDDISRVDETRRGTFVELGSGK